ncbi:hypothetical protein EDWATA_02463 [Edwardsiella tarda ATCC 23685]|uniref:Uncharacterized protein n=1 Tax=Edwardsiella tarda ATCC 23685 TaxID=500638 RepID=D4F6S9_EDWTA|nr:hypothetical protein EDWATA_02463 [Edwardsiella tarda ATCC 23685]
MGITISNNSFTIDAAFLFPFLRHRLQQMCFLGRALRTFYGKMRPDFYSRSRKRHSSSCVPCAIYIRSVP